MNPERKISLGGALAAAATSSIGIAFLGGCLYPFLMRWLSGSHAAATRPLYNDLNLMVLLSFGLLTAMIALPVVLVLICGIGLPLFRLWIRRGYTNVALYVAGGIIIAVIGSLIMAAAHAVGGFLSDSDLQFAMLLIAVSGPIGGFVVWYALRHSLAASSG